MLDDSVRNEVASWISTHYHEVRTPSESSEEKC
jgi:hypothetical protein